jgi:hypothetical protein
MSGLTLSGPNPYFDFLDGYLDKHSDCSGEVSLFELNAVVRWWVLSQEIIAGGKTWNNRGHVGSEVSLAAWAV